MSLRAKLLGLFGLMAVLGLAAFLGLWLYGVPVLGVEGMFSQEYRRTIVSVEALADKERDTYERWFEEHRRELRVFAGDEQTSRTVATFLGTRTVTAAGQRERLQRELAAIKESSPGTYRYLYVAEPGRMRVLVASDSDLRAPALSHLPLLRDAGEPGMSEFVRVVHEALGPSVLVMNQILERDLQGVPTGKVLGILVAGVVLGAPLETDEASIRQTLGETGAVMLVDGQAQVLFNSSRSLTNGDHRFVAEQVVAGTEGVRLLNTPQATELIAVFRHIHLGAADELSLAVTRGTRDALAAIRASFFRMTGLLAVFFLLSMGLVIFATNRIAHAQAEILGLNASLEQRIEVRTRELEQTNASLKDTLHNLERTRDDLVRSEKMAALGSLVAGVAHELNTPIGNSLTVASTLQDNAREFAQTMAKGMTRSALEAFVVNAREGADILMNSLQRAAALVSSFKQVAVDQTSDHRRRFALRETVEEILQTLGPTIRKSAYTVEQCIPSGITLDSFPGPLGQVLTNLINNALLHAFDGREQGTVRLEAAMQDADHVRFTVSDNGAGIAPAHLARVFDPFFTTTLGKGGSGLGLSIVYNLVRDALGGQIQVQSPPGQGACFTLVLPLVAPSAHPSSV